MNISKENSNCPYCLSPIEDAEERVRCPKCGVIHHADCWQDNGKCSVYGCDGWAAWDESISSRIAPDVDKNVKLSAAELVQKKRSEVHVCIECGRPVKAGVLTCRKCRRNQPRHYFDNCAGPSVLCIGAVIGIITWIVKTSL